MPAMEFVALRLSVSLRAAGRLFFISLLLAGLTIVPFAHARQKEVVRPPDKDVTITGVVEKAAVDENDKVIAVEIQEERTEGTEFYLVNDDTKGNELLALVGKQVEVTGVVDEDEDDNKILTVKSFSVK